MKKLREHFPQRKVLVNSTQVFHCTLFVLLSSLSFFAGPSVQAAPDSLYQNQTLKYWLDKFKVSSAASDQASGQSGPAKSFKSQGPLRSLKELESSRQFRACAEQGVKALGKWKDIDPWVVLLQLKCARRAEGLLPEKQSELLKKGLAQASKWSARELALGPWRSQILNELLKTKMELAQLQRKGSQGPQEALLLDLLGDLDRMDRDQRSLLWQYFGDHVLQSKADEVALHFFRVSLGERENKAIRDKLSQLMLKLNLSDNKALDKISPVAEFISDEEKSFEDRLQSSVKSNDIGNFCEDAVQYLSRFPGGRKSKWAYDRLLENHLSVLDNLQGSKSSQDSEKFLGLREKSQRCLLKLDPSRRYDLLKTLHRRGDDESVLALALPLSSELKSSTNSGLVFYSAGRSAQFLGDYRKAKEFFEQYLDRFSGGEEFAEVLFRLGLVFLREGQLSSAIASFEKLILFKGNDRYELSARYWLTKALQWTNNPRFNSERNALIEKYPLSYYGLKLRSEMHPEQILFLPQVSFDAKILKEKVVFTDRQVKGLSRAHLLMANGWWAEAQSEVSDLQIPLETLSKLLNAPLWSELGASPLVIRSVNEASDLLSWARSPEILKMAYPTPLRARVDAESKSSGLSSWLVYSLIRQESAFQVKAVSSSNAIGLMQMIPPTASEIIQDLRLDNKAGRVLVPEDVFEPELNVKMGTYYLGKMVKTFNGNIPLALAAYNAGPTRVGQFTKKRPDVFANEASNFNGFEEMWYDELPWYETSFYVKAILRNLLMYRLLYASSSGDAGGGTTGTTKSTSPAVSSSTSTATSSTVQQSQGSSPSGVGATTSGSTSKGNSSTAGAVMGGVRVGPGFWK